MTPSLEAKSALRRGLVRLCLLALPLGAGCGADTLAEEGGATGRERARDHHLVVNVGTGRFEARGAPAHQVLMIGQREVQIEVGGPLIGGLPGPGAQPGAEGGRAGDLVLELLANGIEPGIYPLMTSPVAVQTGGRPAGSASLRFPAGAPHGLLRARSGTITLEEVSGDGEGLRFRLDRAVGRLSGLFVDAAGSEHQVTLEFTYMR